MAKNAITDYDTDPANNTDVGNIGIQGSNIPSNFDNSQREIMSHLADMNAGTSPLHDTFAVADPADLTKKVRIDAGNVTAGQTRVITAPDEDITLKNLSNVDNTSDADKPVSTAQALALAPIQTTDAGIGQVVAISSGSGVAATLPSGGSWFWVVTLSSMSTGISQGSYSSISAGGTTIGGAVSGSTWDGFCWRITT
jgi:hypothetical protein